GEAVVLGAASAVLFGDVESEEALSARGQPDLARGVPCFSQASTWPATRRVRNSRTLARNSSWSSSKRLRRSHRSAVAVISVHQSIAVVQCAPRVDCRGGKR